MEQKKSDRRRMTAILGAGFLLRLCYVLFSTIYERQYDIGMIDLDAGHTVTGGHLAYIQYLYENWRLPDFDPTTVYQFNHPPLHHYLCALWMKFCSIFISDTAVLEESIQVVPFVCSLLILFFLAKILGQLALTEKAKRFIMLLFAFHPALVLLSGSVNNDCMALLFTVLCAYYTMLWVLYPTIHNILKLALAVGLGMLTKQNVAQMAFPIAGVFLWTLWKEWKKGGFPKRIFVQYGLFGLVSVPLGMCFYIRNMLLYKMPLVWIYTLPKDSWQYTGNVPVLNRFLWPVPSEAVDNLLHFRLGCGYNVWMQIIRTSVLGEWDMADVGKGVKVLAVLLMAAGAVLAFAGILAFLDVFVIRRKRYDISTPVRILFVMSYAVHLLFYLKFAYDYPQECSMHFRYIEIELLFPAAALGFWLQQTEKKWMKYALNTVLAFFCLLSVGMIGVWCAM